MTQVVQLVSALAITAGALLLSLRLLGRARNGTRTLAPLRVLQRVETGPKQAIALVQVLDRVLVVSLGEGGARLLAELSEGERERVLSQGPAAAPAFAWPRLTRLVGVGALLAIASLLTWAPLAHAQAPASAPPQAAASPAAVAPKPAKPAASKGSPRALTAGIGGPSVQAPLAPKVDVRIGSGSSAMQMSGTVGLVVFIGFLTLLPAIFLLMTSFTRILIVLHFLRSALGTQTTPPSQLLAAIAVLLTAVIMNPVLERTQRDALQPYFEGRITQTEAYTRGIVPFREFMLTHTRAKDLDMFAEASGRSAEEKLEDLPIVTIVSAFVTSELRTAFQMGFAVFLPFVIVDVVVASVLMSLGMFMLPPAMISLPFKLLLFVLADGWSLVFQNLMASFR